MIVSVLKQAVMISGFVLVMMLLIEYVNVQTQGTWQRYMGESPWRQYLPAALLGAIPGCLGAFTVVSLYTHRLMGLGAVVAAMIATSGDEAFVMFSMVPGTALWLTAALLILGMAAGYLTDRTVKNPYALIDHLQHQLPLHESEGCRCFNMKEIVEQWRKMSFERALLSGLILLILVLVLTGTIGPDKWNWMRSTILAGTLFALYVVVTVPDHFLEEHLWEHILKKHLFRIFLWTFGTLLVLGLFTMQFDVDSWVQNNLWLVLLIAVLVGIIPESGPHLVFVTMFASGTLPLPVLVASSIVQDGHGMLPLLAESRQSFLVVKLINVAVGFAVGGLLLIILK